MLTIYFTYQINLLKKETFAATPPITEEINRVYNADLDAVRNLSEIALKLTTGGLTVPGNLSITGKTTIDNSLIMGKSGDGVSSSISDSKYDSNSLCIVGQGNSPNRKITMWDKCDIRGTLSTASTIYCGGDIVMKSGTTIQSDGVTHITTPKDLHLLAGTSGGQVIINKAWGGNGNLHVHGNTQVDGNQQVNGKQTVIGDLQVIGAITVGSIRIGDWTIYNVPGDQGGSLRFHKDNSRYYQMFGGSSKFWIS